MDFLWFPRELTNIADEAYVDPGQGRPRPAKGTSARNRASLKGHWVGGKDSPLRPPEILSGSLSQREIS